MGRVVVKGGVTGCIVALTIPIPCRKKARSESVPVWNHGLQKAALEARGWSEEEVPAITNTALGLRSEASGHGGSRIPKG